MGFVTVWDDCCVILAKFVDYVDEFEFQLIQEVF
jgi:hypothetical protein